LIIEKVSPKVAGLRDRAQAAANADEIIQDVSEVYGLLVGIQGEVVKLGISTASYTNKVDCERAAVKLLKGIDTVNEGITAKCAADPNWGGPELGHICGKGIC
jgi:hypothetical protein